MSYSLPRLTTLLLFLAIHHSRANEGVLEQLRSKFGELLQPSGQKTPTPKAPPLEPPGLEWFHRTEKESGRAAAEKEFLTDFIKSVDEWWQDGDPKVHQETMEWLEGFKTSQKEWGSLTPLIKQRLAEAHAKEPALQNIRAASAAEMLHQQDEAAVAFQAVMDEGPENPAIRMAALRWFTRQKNPKASAMLKGLSGPELLLLRSELPDIIRGIQDASEQQKVISAVFDSIAAAPKERSKSDNALLIVRILEFWLANLQPRNLTGDHVALAIRGIRLTAESPLAIRQAFRQLSRLVPPEATNHSDLVQKLAADIIQSPSPVRINHQLPLEAQHGSDAAPQGDSVEIYLLAWAIIHEDASFITEQLDPLVKEQCSPEIHEALTLAIRLSQAEGKDFLDSAAAFLKQDQPTHPSIKLARLQFLQRIMAWRKGQEQWLPLLEQELKAAESANLSNEEISTLRWMVVRNLEQTRGVPAAMAFLEQYALETLGPFSERMAKLLSLIDTENDGSQKAVEKFRAFWDSRHNTSSPLRFYASYYREYCQFVIADTAPTSLSYLDRTVAETPWPVLRENLQLTPLLAEATNFDAWLISTQSDPRTVFGEIWALVYKHNLLAKITPPEPSASLGERLMFTAAAPRPLDAALSILEEAPETISQLNLLQRIGLGAVVQEIARATSNRPPPTNYVSPMRHEAYLAWTELSKLSNFRRWQALRAVTTRRQYRKLMADGIAEQPFLDLLWQQAPSEIWTTIEEIKRCENLPALPNESSSSFEPQIPRTILGLLRAASNSSQLGLRWKQRPAADLMRLLHVAAQTMETSIEAKLAAANVMERLIGGIDGPLPTQAWQALVTLVGGELSEIEGLKLAPAFISLLYDTRTSRRGASAWDDSLRQWMRDQSTAPVPHAWLASLLSGLDDWWGSRDHESDVTSSRWEYARTSQIPLKSVRSVNPSPAAKALFIKAEKLAPASSARADYLEELLWWSQGTAEDELIVEAARARLLAIPKKFPYYNPPGSSMLLTLVACLNSGRTETIKAVTPVARDWLAALSVEVTTPGISRRWNLRTLLDLASKLGDSETMVKLINLDGANFGIEAIPALVAGGAVPVAKQYWNRLQLRLSQPDRANENPTARFETTTKSMDTSFTEFLEMLPDSEAYAIEVLLLGNRPPNSFPGVPPPPPPNQHHALAQRWSESAALDPTFRAELMVELLRVDGSSALIGVHEMKQLLSSLPEEQPQPTANATPSRPGPQPSMPGTARRPNTAVSRESWNRLIIQNALARQLAMEGDWDPLLTSLSSAATLAAQKPVAKPSDGRQVNFQALGENSDRHVLDPSALWWETFIRLTQELWPELSVERRTALREFSAAFLANEESTAALDPSALTVDNGSMQEPLYRQRMMSLMEKGYHLRYFTQDLWRLTHLLTLYARDDAWAEFERFWESLPVKRREFLGALMHRRYSSSTMNGMILCLTNGFPPLQRYHTASRLLQISGVPEKRGVGRLNSNLNYTMGSWQWIAGNSELPDAFITDKVTASVTPESSASELLEAVLWAIHQQTPEPARTWAGWLRPKFSNLGPADFSDEAGLAMAVGDLDWATSALENAVPRSSNTYEAKRQAALKWHHSALLAGSPSLFDYPPTEISEVRYGGNCATIEDFHRLGQVYRARNEPKRARACFLLAAILSQAVMDAGAQPHSTPPYRESQRHLQAANEGKCATVAMVTPNQPWQMNNENPPTDEHWHSNFKKEPNWDSASELILPRRPTNSTPSSLRLRIQFNHDPEQTTTASLCLTLPRSLSRRCWINGAELLGQKPHRLAPVFSSQESDIYRIPASHLRPGLNTLAWESLPGMSLQLRSDARPRLTPDTMTPLEELQAIDRKALRADLGEELWRAIPSYLRSHIGP